MHGRVVELIKEKPYYLPQILFENYKKLELTDFELIFLIYLLNNNETFNPKLIAHKLNINLPEVMNSITSLTEKGFLKLEVTKKGLKNEYINLEDLYKKLSFLLVSEKEETKTNLYDIFELEFARTLSPMDYEFIAAWQNANADELIILALKEAVYNGATTLKYVDKVLASWNKKGIKTKEQVEQDKIKFESNKANKKLFDYDWLNDRDN